MLEMTFKKKTMLTLIIIFISVSLSSCAFPFMSQSEDPEPEPYTGPDYTAFDPYFPFDQETEMMNRLQDLREKTKDAAGWIRIPGTDVDFPIVQGSDNVYYLNHDHLGKRTSYGAIFMDYRNNPLVGDRNTILYGHNMKDDKMFGKLMPFKDSEFALTHPYIELVTEKGYSVWKIFSAHVTSRDFYYIHVKYSSDEKFMDFLSALQEKSLHDFEVSLKPDDRILTLSTCSYEFKDAFFPMHAVLVYEYDFEEHLQEPTEEDQNDE